MKAIKSLVTLFATSSGKEDVLRFSNVMYAQWKIMKRHFSSLQRQLYQLTK